MTIAETDLLGVPQEHRRLIATWMLERAAQYRPSAFLAERDAFLITGTLAGVATDLMDPGSDDATLERQQEVITDLIGKPRLTG